MYDNKGSKTIIDGERLSNTINKQFASSGSKPTAKLDHTLIET